MYYYLVDVNFTPIQISSLDIRLLDSPSLIVYWVRTAAYRKDLARFSFVVVDGKGSVLSCCWPHKANVSNYLMDLIENISTDADDWDIKTYSFYRRKIASVYSGLWKTKVRLLPELNSMLGSIMEK